MSNVKLVDATDSSEPDCSTLCILDADQGGLDLRGNDTTNRMTAKTKLKISQQHNDFIRKANYLSAAKPVALLVLHRQRIFVARRRQQLPHAPMSVPAFRPREHAMKH
jgi:hypothetical protein